MTTLQLPRLTNWSAVTWREGEFSSAECDRILALGTEMKDGKVVDSEGTAPYRDSRVCWLRPGPATMWLFNRLSQIIQQVNQAHYCLDLAGFTEPLQISEYAEDHFYDWHLDVGNEGFSIRKLSFIVQLSDADDYEGGEVELFYKRDPFAALKSRGTMTVFPSYVLHRVKPVTRGSRWSLVGWIGGPPLR